MYAIINQDSDKQKLAEELIEASLALAAALRRGMPRKRGYAPGQNTGVFDRPGEHTRTSAARLLE